MKIEFHSSKFNKDNHKIIEYQSSHEMRTKLHRSTEQNQEEEIKCYLWPGLQDGGGRPIRAAEVICKAKE